jgi:hypothetical protein
MALKVSISEPSLLEASDSPVDRMKRAENSLLKKNSSPTHKMPIPKATDILRDPRTPKKGGGVIKMRNPSIKAALEAAAAAATDGESDRDGSSPGARAGMRVMRRPSEGGASQRSGSRSDPDKKSAASAVSSPTAAKANKQMGQTERKQMEIYAKWQKNEALRERDVKMAMEKVEFGHEMRDDRFRRLLDTVSGKDNLAYRTAVALREREAHEETRKRALFESWEEKVFQPLAKQSHEYCNPADRKQQQESIGAKNVDFRMPEEKNYLKADISADPCKQSHIWRERERAFHRAACRILGSSQSAPELEMHGGGSPYDSPTSHGAMGPNPRSKPVLEPTNWGQQAFQGTMFGHFAAVNEFGPGFSRTIRGGANVHIPDASDGVLVAGSRHHRELGHGDVGILRGSTAAQGEGYNYKTPQGASSIAPAQDHFTFESGKRISDLEFPQGKRIFPEFH